MFLQALSAWVDANREDLDSRGVEVTLSKRWDTEKSAQWLRMAFGVMEAEIGVWESGECETAIGFADGSREPVQAHHDLLASTELASVLDDLAAKLVT